MTRRGVRKHWHLPLAIALLAVAGCGPQTGTINGKVMFPAGKPLPGGMVTFYDASGAPHGAQVQRDGSFMAANLPPGPAKAIVVTVKSRGTLANPEAVKEPYGPYVQIPRKYNDVATSGLQLEVKAGQQDFPIELKEEWAEGEKPQ